MNELLTRNEIRTICLESGFSLKPQPDGPDDLHPYVYTAAHALIERALKSVLIVHQRSKSAVLKLDPNSTLDIPQYDSICPQYGRDFQTLEALMDTLQASLVQRQVNSTKLWNMSVVDKHGELIYGVSSQRLGPAMHSLIEGVKAAIVPFKNEPLLESETPLQTLEKLCREKSVALDIPVQTLGELSLNRVKIEACDLDNCIDAAIGVLKSPWIDIKYPTNNEPYEMQVADFGLTRGAFYLTPVFEHYDNMRCSEWSDDWNTMKQLAEFCELSLTAEEKGKFTCIVLNDVRFTSHVASTAMKYANCYLTTLVRTAAKKEKYHA